MQVLSRVWLFAVEQEICNSEKTEGVVWGDLAGGEGVQMCM